MKGIVMVEEQKVMNRWLVVVGAILVQLSLGAIYAWSVFTKKITRAVVEGGYGFSAQQAASIFSAGLATFAIVMVIVGPWAKKEPRKATMLGGLVLGLGYVLGGFLGSNFIMQFVCIGLIGGAGIGIAYVVPIAVGVKWFPDKKGLIAGLGVKAALIPFHGWLPQAMVAPAPVSALLHAVAVVKAGVKGC